MLWALEVEIPEIRRLRRSDHERQFDVLMGQQINDPQYTKDF